MALKIKQTAVKTICETFFKGSSLESLGLTTSTLRFSRNSQDKLTCNFNFFKSNKNNISQDLSEIKKNEDKLLAPGISNQIHFTEINSNGKSITFEVNVKDYVKNVLHSDPIGLSLDPIKEKCIVEFSSPNIAKEFHVGHLRSTIIGSIISNVIKKRGGNVIKMNYLGDWGTQFGLMKLGVDLLEYNDETFKSEPIKKLQKAYVHANKVALGDKELTAKARKIFERLESGDEEMMKAWEKFKEWTVTDLAAMYRRLGITFDEYEWESSYNKNRAQKFIENLDFVKNDELGRKVIEINGKDVPVLKSDGTTLYLLRDVIAFFDRRSRFNVDKIYYVVEGSQSQHFRNLSQICDKVESSSSSRIHYVQFGRISGMSTRKGTNVFLRDLLDEAQQRMYEKMNAVPTTKIVPDLKTADTLGMSAIIVNDIKRSRCSDYNFDWELALSNTGDSGVQLQYAHCRLCSLAKMCSFEMAEECDPDLLSEPEAVALVIEISRFEEFLVLTHKELEPEILIRYLFRLIKAMNIAFKVLKVRDVERSIGRQRLRLFNYTRSVIAEGLRLLGLSVLTAM